MDINANNDIECEDFDCLIMPNEVTIECADDNAHHYHPHTDLMTPQPAHIANNTNPDTNNNTIIANNMPPTTFCYTDINGQQIIANNNSPMYVYQNNVFMPHGAFISGVMTSPNVMTPSPVQCRPPVSPFNYSPLANNRPASYGMYVSASPAAPLPQIQQHNHYSNLANYAILNKLGKGQFSTVYKAVYLGGHVRTVVALKKIQVLHISLRCCRPFVIAGRSIGSVMRFSLPIRAAY